MPMYENQQSQSDSVSDDLGLFDFMVFFDCIMSFGMKCSFFFKGPLWKNGSRPSGWPQKVAFQDPNSTGKEYLATRC